MRSALPFALILASLLTTAQARLGETTQEIAVRYGRPLKGVKTESPATVAGLYETNGIRIVVGFYQNMSYYEQFQKLDLTKPGSFLEIDETEREILLKANCKGCDWNGNVVAKQGFVPGKPIGMTTVYETTYDRSDGLAKATYDSRSRILAVRSLQVEKQVQEDEKRRQEEEAKRQRETLKGF